MRQFLVPIAFVLSMVLVVIMLIVDEILLIKQEKERKDRWKW